MPSVEKPVIPPTEAPSAATAVAVSAVSDSRDNSGESSDSLKVASVEKPVIPPEEATPAAADSPSKLNSGVSPNSSLNVPSVEKPVMPPVAAAAPAISALAEALVLGISVMSPEAALLRLPSAEPSERVGKSSDCLKTDSVEASVALLADLPKREDSLNVLSVENPAMSLDSRVLVTS